jgi:uncharacterized protein (TIGR00661 family)
MRILYGVQGTGNGHISRSKEVIRHLVKYADVDILVSENQHEVALGFDLTYRLRGLGFVFGKSGGIDYWNSVKNAKLTKFISDISKLPVEKYDLVISDFEPITAWAARAKGVPSVSLSHHAAFLSSKTPRPPRKNYLVELIMKWYAPCSIPVGIHFEKYDSFIHTPVIREEVRNADVTNNGHYTVYLPAYDASYISRFLKRIKVRWEVFSKHHKGIPYVEDNIKIYPISDREFVRSMASCEGLLCGAGFDTPSEALCLGKKLMVVPMKGQYEQDCNAEALRRLGVPAVKKIGKSFDRILKDWVGSSFTYRATYDNNVPSIIESILEKAGRN